MIGKYGQNHNITPESIKKDITEIFSFEEEYNTREINMVSEDVVGYDSLDKLDDIIKSLDKEMKKEAKALNFEKAAEIRDQIIDLKEIIVFDSEIRTK